MLLLTHQVAAAGRMPMTYIHRQADGPSGLTKSQTRDAIKKPMPRPHCISPAPLPRCLGGHISATMAAPVAHSDPRARPTMKRRAMKDSSDQANAVRPVVSEYARIA